MSLNTESENKYWTNRYNSDKTGWDLGEPSQPLTQYIDQIKNKEIKILIPGAGNAYEAEYLFVNGFKNVFVLDVSHFPLEEFKKRNPSFPVSQLIHGNFFEHKNKYDLILEQTFFCSFIPSYDNRSLYAQTMDKLLNPNGKLVGVWFNHPLTEDMDKRPFGGSKEEYIKYLSPFFHVKSLNDCYNSYKSRAGKELFGIFEKN